MGSALRMLARHDTFFEVAFVILYDFAPKLELLEGA